MGTFTNRLLSIKQAQMLTIAIRILARIFAYLFTRVKNSHTFNRSFFFANCRRRLTRAQFEALQKASLTQQSAKNQKNSQKLQKN